MSLDYARDTRLKIKTPIKVFLFSAVVYHERVLLLQNESSGTGGNRIPVQKVAVKKSTYIARFFV